MSAVPGRPTSLTPDVHKAICDALRNSNPRMIAAKVAGVGYSTFKTWMVRGRKGEEPFASLLADVQKAEAEAVARNVALIQTAAIDTWQAAAWMLERRYPEWFSRELLKLKELERQVAALERVIREGVPTT